MLPVLQTSSDIGRPLTQPAPGSGRERRRARIVRPAQGEEPWYSPSIFPGRPANGQDARPPSLPTISYDSPALTGQRSLGGLGCLRWTARVCVGVTSGCAEFKPRAFGSRAVRLIHTGTVRQFCAAQGRWPCFPGTLHHLDRVATIRSWHRCWILRGSAREMLVGKPD